MPSPVLKTGLKVVGGLVVVALSFVATLEFFDRTAVTTPPDHQVIANAPPERRLEGRGTTLAAVWPVVTRGKISVENGLLAFVEDTADGEHFLATPELMKGDRIEVQVSATIDAGAVEPTEGVMLYLISGDGTAFVQFDLAQVKSLKPQELGARVLDGSIRRLANGRLELLARFEVVGDKKRFHIRLQTTRNGVGSYKGTGRTGWKVDSTVVRMFDTGRS